MQMFLVISSFVEEEEDGLATICYSWEAKAGSLVGLNQASTSGQMGGFEMIFGILLCVFWEMIEWFELERWGGGG